MDYNSKLVDANSIALWYDKASNSVKRAYEGNDCTVMKYEGFTGDEVS